MSSVKPASNTSYWAYLSPINIIKIPSYLIQAVSAIFSRTFYSPQAPAPHVSMTAREVTVSELHDPSDEYVFPGGIIDYFNRGQKSDVYPLIKVTLSDGSQIEVAKTFLTDMERMGSLRYYIDQTRIRAAKTDEEKVKLLERMLEIAKGDRKAVTEWTQIWNFRPLQAMMYEVMLKFHDKYNLNPVFEQTRLEDVVITLNTQASLLTCYIMGTIAKGMDTELNVNDRLTNVYHEEIIARYEADMTYEAAAGELVKNISFKEEKKPTVSGSGGLL